MYLTCRTLGGSLKASLHQSGRWHLAYSQKTFDERVKGAIPKFSDRFIEKWPRPAEIAPGMTLAYRIVTPCTAPTNKKQPSETNKLIWLPNAPDMKATEIDVLITRPDVVTTGWPGKRSMGTSLIGSFPLENGDTVWAVHWVVAMPNFESLGKGVGRFYHGRSKDDLKGEGMRVLVFGEEPDGSRVMYDCPFRYNS